MKSVRFVLSIAVLFSGVQGLVGAQYRLALIKPESPEKAVIIFERSGGFAGLDEVYNIYANGLIKNEKGKRRRVDVSQVQSLLRRAATLHLPDSREEDTPNDMCADCFHYRVKVYTRDGHQTFSRSELRTEADDGVSRLVRDVRDLVLHVNW